MFKFLCRYRACSWLILTSLNVSLAAEVSSASPPNVVVIFADDLGYGDLHCFGSPYADTPNLDKMAAEGRKFTSFYVAQAVCSASRTALLTGCYPNRLGIQGALGPQAEHGLNQDETTIASLLKSRGYATAIYGKWHLGHHPEFLPTRRGFDEYFGLPYSNDMWPKHPQSKFPDLPLIEGEKTKEVNPDQSQLVTWYTEHAVDFIRRNHAKPFFLYVPHAMPHVPIFVSDKHAGKSARGLYGDVIREIDWSVGQILQTLRETGLDEKTLVIFTSDNGPWLSYGNHAGSAGPLREGKATAWEGGVRVPCVMRWPKVIPAGTTCNELAATIDILPTIASLSGMPWSGSSARPIDGLDIKRLLTGDAKSPHEAYWLYWNNELHAIRSGRWKLHFPHPYPHIDEPGKDGKPGKISQRKTELELYDLEQDLGETTNVAEKEPDIVKRLTALAEIARNDLGDSLTNRPAKNARPVGKRE